MKKYEAPEMEVEVVEVEDIVTTSPGGPTTEPGTGLPIL